MGDIVLVTGGARSGKSGFAETYASSKSASVAYIATAQVLDDEMQYRVHLHQCRRPATWGLWETPLHAERAIEEAGRVHEVLLFDCLTMYLSNIMFSDGFLDLTEQVQYRRVEEVATNLIKAAQGGTATTIFVTNEVGAGIVPEHASARRYRDLAGLLNQRIASAATEVYLVVSGIPVEIKRLGIGDGKHDKNNHVDGN